ncbi:MAG: PilZ domain-containing protein [bacterium]
MGKRKMSRVDFKIDAVINRNNTKKICSVRNLSLAGMYLVTDIDIVSGDNIDITVKVASGSTSGEIELSGIVVRKEHDGFALEFLDLPLDSYLFLRNVVVYNSGDPDTIDQEYRRHLALRKMKTKDNS